MGHEEAWSVHPDYIGNTWMTILIRQYGRGNVDDSNSGDVENSNPDNIIEASLHCELNIYANYEPTYFQEVSSHYEWRESM